MVQATSLYSKANTQPTDLGTVQWEWRCALAAFLVLVRQPKPAQERAVAMQSIGSAESVMLQ
ncbi:hypothetical protein NNRS527_00504 [Nitrosospira sp. NRS527]|nr:hypothetical protein NNRS527_00504 [Nitrosospira sp. NRS527]